MCTFTIGFVEIWTQFQNKAQEIIDELVSDPEHILWTSTLTSDEYISNVPKDYTIQIWTDSAVSLNLFTYFFISGYLGRVLKMQFLLVVQEKSNAMYILSPTRVVRKLSSSTLWTKNVKVVQ